MKISRMIKNLQEFMNNNGDLDCYYAIDDEGNGYKEVHYSPSMYYVNGYGDMFQQEDYDEADEEDKKDLIPVCVVN